MGTSNTPSHVRGLLINDPRFTYAGAFDKDNSVYTENTARPGVPKAQNNSDLVLETSGTSLSKEYAIYSQNSGYPEDNGGSFLFYDTDINSSYKHYGWEPPHAITGIQKVHRGSNAVHFKNYDICTTLDDTLIIASVGTGLNGLRIHYRKSSETTWTTLQPPFFIEPGMLMVSGDRPTDTSDAAAQLDAGVDQGPALCVLPSGRVLCFYWIRTAREYTATSGNSYIDSYNVQAVYSDDNGATWDIYQNFCLIEPLTQQSDVRTNGDGRYHPGRLRAAYKDGQILMLSSAFDTGNGTVQGSPTDEANILLQFASSSLGATFETVYIEERTNNPTCSYDIAVSGDSFVVCYVSNASQLGRPYVVKLGNAFTPLNQIVGVSDIYADNPLAQSFAELLSATTGDSVGRADLSICAAPDGSMYLIGVRHGSNSDSALRHSMAVMYSGDNGNTWEMVGGDFTTDQVKKAGTVYAARFFDEPAGTGDLTRDTFRNIAVTWQRGRLVMAARFEYTLSGGTIYDDGEIVPDVAALFIGGYSNFTIGSIDAAIKIADRGTYARHYLPFTEPSNMDDPWTITGSGTAFGDGVEHDANERPRLKVQTISGIQSYKADEFNHTDARNDRTDVGTWGGPMLTYCEFAVDIVDGGNQTTPVIGVEIKNGNTDGKTHIALCFDLDGSGDTRLTIRDLQAVSTIYSSSISFSAGDFGEYRVEVLDRTLAVWYRVYDEYENRREWTKFYESPQPELAQLTGSGYCQLIWGHVATGTGTSQWYKIQGGAHDGDLNHCAVPRMNDWLGYTAPDNVGGRFFSTSPIYVEDGIKIEAKDGPAIKAEEWIITPRYDYPVAAIHHEMIASPAHAWRTTGSAVDHELIWNIDTADPAMMLGGLRAFYLGNINFRYCELYGYDGASWNLITGIDAAIPVQYVRKGNTITAGITPTGAQTGNFVWTYDSLKNCTFRFDDLTAVNITNISTNSEGTFEANGTKKPVLIVDSGIGQPALGDGQIWVKDLCVLLPEDTVDVYERIKLKIPATTPFSSAQNKTVTGDWQIGLAMFGHVAVFGRQYGNGHIRQIDTNTELFTATGGQRAAVKRGEPRKAVEFAWSEPVDISSMGESSPSADYVSIANDKTATLDNSPFLMQGIITQLSGSKDPVVFLPSIDTNINSATTIHDSNRFLYGRIVSNTMRIENVVGDEWIGNKAGEAVRISTIRIEQEL